MKNNPNNLRPFQIPQAAIPKIIKPEEFKKFFALLEESRKKKKPEEITLGERTEAMLLNNDKVFKVSNGRPVRKFGNLRVPCVTSLTSNFNATLFSSGSSGREDILLDPSSKTLQENYNILKFYLLSLLSPNSRLTALQILEAMNIFTGQQLLPNHNIDFSDSNLEAVDNVISLGSFVRAKAGVCRHHALLNCYFLSRLKEDGLLEGEIIYHRQNVINNGKQGAHAWVILQAGDRTYSLDSLNNNYHCIQDEPEYLNSTWGEDTKEKIEQTIQKRVNSRDAKKKVELKKLLQKKFNNVNNDRLGSAAPVVLLINKKFQSYQKQIKQLKSKAEVDDCKKSAIDTLNELLENVIEEAKKEKKLNQTIEELLKPTENALVRFNKLSGFYKSLNEIVLQVKNLQERGHENAKATAEGLILHLKDEVNTYLKSNSNEEDANLDFKNKCLEKIELARPVLEKHRGWKQLLGNLTLAVLGMGVGYIIAGCINKILTGKFLFFRTTRSKQKLDDLKKAIEESNPSKLKEPPKVV